MPPTPGSPARHVVGTAPLWVLGLVAGPRRLARVLHAGPEAAYLDLDGNCVGVLAARAVQVPCGIRTDLDALPRLTAADRAEVEGGTVVLQGADASVEVTVGAVVDTTVPVLAAEAAAHGARRLRARSARLSPVLAELPGEPLRTLAGADPDAVRRLLGLGGGLTPVGDDVLAGWLAAAVATRHPALAAVRGEVALAARERTTTLSATLLACAARGEVVPPFRSMLAGLASADDSAVDRSLDRLLDIGDTSGTGLALGALLAFESLPPFPRGEATG